MAAGGVRRRLPARCGRRAVEVFDSKPYFLPAPSRDLGRRSATTSTLIWDATKVSGANALVGLLVGTVLGVAMAFLLMRFRLLNDMSTPLAIALNAIPIFVLVVGVQQHVRDHGEIPRRLMVTLVVYFIVLVNVAKGLRQVESDPPRADALVRRERVGRSCARCACRTPCRTCSPALKIAAPAAVITAFVAEYFGGSQNGLGSRITSNIAVSKTAAAWAYVLGACLLGLVFYLISIALGEHHHTPEGRQPRGRNHDMTTRVSMATASATRGRARRRGMRRRRRRRRRSRYTTQRQRRRRRYHRRRPPRRRQRPSTRHDGAGGTEATGRTAATSGTAAGECDDHRRR